MAWFIGTPPLPSWVRDADANEGETDRKTERKTYRDTEAQRQTEVKVQPH